MKKRFDIKIFRSIQFYIIVMVVLAGIIPCFFLTTTLLSSYETQTVESTTASITNQAIILSNRLVDEDYLSTPRSGRIEERMSLLADFYDGRVMIVDQNYNIIYDSYDLDTDKTVVSSLLFDAFQGENQSVYDSDYQYIGVVVPITQDGTVIGAVMTSVSTSDLHNNLKNITRNAWIMIAAVFLLVVIIAFLGSSKLIKPFNVMSKSIDDIQLDYDADQLMVLDYTETQQISNAFNEMLGRMKTVDDSRKDFVANVSHELKTPLTSMKVLADSLLNMGEAPVEMYREFLEDINAEIDRENNIINDLLALVKMDQGQGALNIAPVNINELVDRVIKMLKPQLSKYHIELAFENLKPVIAEVDEVKMTQVFMNLIENAIKYNFEDGWIHVSLNADGQFFFLKVEDSGLGIPEESLDHIFERFYRVDKSHSREIGGTGLGLAIVRSTVLLHRGAIKVDSTEGKGTTFIIRIPLIYAAS